MEHVDKRQSATQIDSRRLEVITILHVQLVTVITGRPLPQILIHYIILCGLRIQMISELQVRQLNYSTNLSFSR